MNSHKNSGLLTNDALRADIVEDAIQRLVFSDEVDANPARAEDLAIVEEALDRAKKHLVEMHLLATEVAHALPSSPHADALVRLVAGQTGLAETQIAQHQERNPPPRRWRVKGEHELSSAALRTGIADPFPEVPVGHDPVAAMASQQTKSPSPEL